jgi:hypothetical protein
MYFSRTAGPLSYSTLFLLSVYGRVDVSRAPALFRQSDLTRAIRAALKAGCKVTGATVDTDGRIRVIIGEGDDPMQARDARTVAADRIARMKMGAGQ